MNLPGEPLRYPLYYGSEIMLTPVPKIEDR